MNYLIGFLIVIGVLVALFGAAVDYLLPGTSPGLNLPQLLIIASGLALSFGSWQLRRPGVRRRFSSSTGKTIAIALSITLITLLVLEIVLTVWGMPTYFPSDIRETKVKVLAWRVCDELGCHYDYEGVLAACADGIITGRRCVVNRQGFSDTDDFAVGEDFRGRMRIMTLGDSFTQGFSADVGKSYVETIEAMLPEGVVWNTAISGSGTNQAVVTFQAFAPQLKPQLSILGFVMNDFRDNLVPLGGWLHLQDSEGTLHFVRRFYMDRWGNPVELPADVVYAYVSKGYNPPVSELERVTGLTRLGTLVLRLLDSLGKIHVGESLETQKRLTRQYLTQLRDAASALDSSLLILLIPQRTDIGKLSELYLTAIELMQELEIPYLNPIDRLDPVADYAPPPDGHWNNAGHQKVGALLADCVATFIASGDLGQCDNVVMPAQQGSY